MNFWFFKLWRLEARQVRISDGASKYTPELEFSGTTHCIRAAISLHFFANFNAIFDEFSKFISIPALQ